MCFKAPLDGDINLQDNVQPIDMSVCSLRLSVAGRPTRVPLSARGCPSSLRLCALHIYCITALFCFLFGHVGLELGIDPHLLSFYFLISHTRNGEGNMYEQAFNPNAPAQLGPVWSTTVCGFLCQRAHSEAATVNFLSPATVTNQDCFLIVWTQFGLSNLGSCVSPSCAAEDKAVKETLYWG